MDEEELLDTNSDAFTWRSFIKSTILTLVLMSIPLLLALLLAAIYLGSIGESFHI